MINYSIIIPHFNVPFLLKRCIASIPFREDLEIIVVDDCSNTDFKCVLEDVCANDKHANLKLIELPSNGGGGHARNEGLKEAVGKFIIFADSDDFFNYCIHDILDDYLNTDADVIYFKGNCINSITYEVGNRLDYINKKIDKFLSDPINNDYELRYLFQIPVCKIIRHSLIVENNLLFDETKIRNDVTFSYKLGDFAKHIVADSRALYCATIRDGSVSSFRGADSILTTIEILGRAVLFFRSKGKKYYETTLSHNLYILLRRKDNINFIKGVIVLNNLGFDKKDINRFFSKRMAETAISSCVWCLLHSPIFEIRLYSLFYFPKALLGIFH